MPKNTNSLINIYHPPPLNFWGCGNMQSNNHKNHPVGGTATVQHLTRTNKNKILCSRCTPHRMTAAFTLVELAIVLVIIGLVIGGVFVGQDLIYSAHLRATMQDIEKYKTAVNTFKTKYNCIPGDCPNAYDYFGSACGKNVLMVGVGANVGVNAPVIPNAGGSDNACNGNGDGIISMYWSGAANQENLLFWQELALAGLISGNYNARTGGNNNWLVPNILVPAGRIGNTVYSIYYSTNYGNFFQWSTYNPQGVWDIAGKGVMTATQAFAFDTKFDDGLPSSGGVRASGCITGIPHTYSVASTNSNCIFYFQAGF